VCGRFNLTRPQEIEARFGFLDWHERRVVPRFNIAPTQEILTIVQPAPGTPTVQLARWGLVPDWLPSGDKRGRPQINARAETVVHQPLFRRALVGSRCLIPATGFYEWRGVSDPKVRQPMHIRLRSDELFAFAGLWFPGAGDGPPTAAIITTMPNELMAPIHSRMPAILRRQDEALWVDPTVTEPAVLAPCLQPYPASAMLATPVSSLVNSHVNDNAEVLRPAEVIQPGLW